MATVDGEIVKGASRRDFIKTSGAALAAAAMAAPFGAHAASSGTLKVGLIGCGGRGGGAIVEALKADPNTKLVALGDAFEDQIKATLKKLDESAVKNQVDVKKKHQYVGFDAYKGVIDAVDVVVMASPPAFRPKHLKYAIEQDKHVFCEKPIAVDPVGVRSVMETVRLAEQKKLNLVSGLCYRYSFAKQDTLNQIHEGKLGDILNIQTTYYGGGLWHKKRRKDWSEMEYQVRNWIYQDWLSGDHIVEQHIHSLDKAAWALGDASPVRIMASGGRAQRTQDEYGNVYDHFNTVFEYDNGVKVFSACRQWDNTDTDVSDHVVGTEGTASLQDHTIKFRDGSTWAHEGSGPDNMYQNEHDALFAAIRNGEVINNGHYMCNSTLMAIAGRMSAYTGRILEWKDVMESDLDLMPKELAWGDIEQRPIAVPGQEALKRG